MDVGMGVFFQGLDGPSQDTRVYGEDLRMAHQAEPLGFDSIWATEHHFTDYQVTPAPLQFLSYMAGRTERVRLGTNAVILPWHDPVRLAAEVNLLDQLSGGRAILGLGRGLGEVEFDGFRVPMSESRERFEVGTRLLLEALETGVMQSEHPMFRIPRRVIRPAPTRSFHGRTYAVGVSPESIESIARMGLGLLCSVQKPWDTVAEDMALYRGTFAAHHDFEPPAPVVMSFTFCDEDPGRARDMAYQYIGAYYHSVIAHYKLNGDHFADVQGYELYAKGAKIMQATGDEKAAKFFADLHVWGTPDQCVERILQLREVLGADTFVANLSYGGLTPDEVDRNLKLFATAVLPRLHALAPSAVEPVVA